MLVTGDTITSHITPRQATVELHLLLLLLQDVAQSFKLVTCRALLLG